MNNIIYEDDIVVAQIPEQAATIGHIRVYAKKEYETVNDVLPIEFAHMWSVASTAASLLFEGLQAQGTNLIMNDMNNDFFIDVIARSENDGIDFEFKPVQVDEGVLNDCASKIKDKADLIGHAKPKTEAVDMDTKEEIKSDSADEENENYYIKSLHRLP